MSCADVSLTSSRTRKHRQAVTKLTAWLSRTREREGKEGGQGKRTEKGEKGRENVKREG